MGYFGCATSQTPPTGRGCLVAGGETRGAREGPPTLALTWGVSLMYQYDQANPNILVLEIATLINWYGLNESLTYWYGTGIPNVLVRWKSSLSNRMKLTFK